MANFELIAITLLVVVLSILSIIPIIELKYSRDLNTNINNYNALCNDNAVTAKDFTKVPIKKTYMWNMCNYLFDFDMIQQNFKSSTEYAVGHIGQIGTVGQQKYEDIQNLNRDLSIVDGKFNIMKVYNKYLHNSIPLFLVIWILFFVHVYFSNNNQDDNIFEYTIYSSIILFVYVSIYTITFSLILKKTTEIYADTLAYEYIMIMKELDIIIKENDDSNKYILDIIKSYSHNDIVSVSDIVFNDALINELTNIHKEKKKNNETIRNYNDYHLTLEHIDKLYVYNSKKTSDKINIEIDDVTRFLITYPVIILAPLYILSLALKETYVFIVISIIVILVISIFAYSLKNSLE
jgi:hypothetical protein